MIDRYIIKTKEIKVKSNEIASEEQTAETVEDTDMLSVINSKLDLLLQAQNIQEVE